MSLKERIWNIIGPFNWLFSSFKSDYETLSSLVILSKKFPKLNDIIKDIATPEVINKTGTDGLTILQRDGIFCPNMETIKILLEYDATAPPLSNHIKYLANNIKILNIKN